MPCIRRPISRQRTAIANRRDELRPCLGAKKVTGWNAYHEDPDVAAALTVDMIQMPVSILRPSGSGP